MWAEYVNAEPVGSARPSRAVRARKFHRLVAMIFTATVAANFVAMISGPPPAIITYAPLLPLLFLLGTGIFMLAAPHLRSRRRTSGGGAR
jgi:fatty acid desaturase